MGLQLFAVIAATEGWDWGLQPREPGRLDSLNKLCMLSGFRYGWPL